MILSESSNNFHKFKQVNKQGKKCSTQGKQDKNDYDILIFRKIYVTLFFLCWLQIFNIL